MTELYADAIGKLMDRWRASTNFYVVGVVVALSGIYSVKGGEAAFLGTSLPYYYLPIAVIAWTAVHLFSSTDVCLRIHSMVRKAEPSERWRLMQAVELHPWSCNPFAQQRGVLATVVLRFLTMCQTCFIAANLLAIPLVPLLANLPDEALENTTHSAPPMLISITFIALWAIVAGLVGALFWVSVLRVCRLEVFDGPDCAVVRNKRVWPHLVALITTWPLAFAAWALLSPMAK